MKIFANVYIVVIVFINAVADDYYASWQCYNSYANKYYEFSPLVNSSWTQLSTSGESMWSARSGLASCIFKNKIWVVGGRSDAIQQYNLQYSELNADVWSSNTGESWVQDVNLRGDFFAQNDDALQPGPTAPWYGRYGHTLTRIKLSGSSATELMILTGGFAPDAMNDVWITEDGNEWIFAKMADWSPRGFHGATVFENTLYIAGGSPLNNEVWYIETVKRIPRTIAPLTRAMYSNYTYDIKWAKLPPTPWSPRAGLGFITHYHPPIDFPFLPAKERILVVGGYGGWPKMHSNSHNFTDDYLKSHAYDGYRGRADVWEYSLNVTGNNESTRLPTDVSERGYVWKLLTSKAAFGGRAWFGLSSMVGINPWEPSTVAASKRNLPPTIILVGGGYLGSDSGQEGSREVRTVEGRVDSYWTKDGITWSRTNKQLGGAGQTRALWSSSDWACFKINAKVHVFRGVWGHNLLQFNTLLRNQSFGDLYMMGGVSDTSDGGVLNRILKSNFHLLCFSDGQECSGIGICRDGIGCDGCTGNDYCQDGTVINQQSSSRRNSLISSSLIAMSIGVTFLLTR